MNKTFGLTERYKPIRREVTRIVVRYGIEQYDEKNSFWYEVYFNKNEHPTVTLEEIKEAIFADINAHTDEKILSGFVWNGKPVWLSSENQFNFKAAYDLAVQTQGQNLPLKFKLGENEDNEPVYHTFNTVEELNDFYLSAIAFIQRCLNEGWELKDGIDFSVYKTN